MAASASAWARAASADSAPIVPAQLGAPSVTSIRNFGWSMGNVRRCAAPAAIATAVGEPSPVRFVAPMATATASALNGVTGTSTSAVTVPAPQAGPALGNAYSPQSNRFPLPTIWLVNSSSSSVHFDRSPDTD